ncbi:MAG: DUF1836 domain-containing protein [bacterium]|nr:DUF1836 domain-containing protein [bacterium]
MEENESASLEAFIGYRMPRYETIPNIGLYLNQVVKYISEVLEPFNGMEITESMISNYVKKRVIARPVKKLYYRKQISELIFISFAKQAASIEDVQVLLLRMRDDYGEGVAYDLFCEWFEQALRSTFPQGGFVEAPDASSERNRIERIVQTIVSIVASKVCLERCFEELQGE